MTDSLEQWCYPIVMMNLEFLYVLLRANDVADRLAKDVSRPSPLDVRFGCPSSVAFLSRGNKFYSLLKKKR